MKRKCYNIKCGCGLPQKITKESETEGKETNAIRCVCGAIHKVEWVNNLPILKEWVNPIPFGFF